MTVAVRRRPTSSGTRTQTSGLFGVDSMDSVSTSMVSLNETSSFGGGLFLVIYSEQPILGLTSRQGNTTVVLEVSFLRLECGVHDRLHI